MSLSRVRHILILVLLLLILSLKVRVSAKRRPVQQQIPVAEKQQNSALPPAKVGRNRVSRNKEVTVQPPADGAEPRPLLKEKLLEIKSAAPPPLLKDQLVKDQLVKEKALPPDENTDSRQAQQLLDCYREGRLTLTVPEREEQQLRGLARDGFYSWDPPTNGKADRLLLHMLTALAAHSSPERPLELMSLLRPTYRTGGFVHVGPNNPHSLGLAADIAAYDGHRISQDRPDECVAATLALLRALPPGRYRLGMPKAPAGPLIVGLPPLPPEFADWSVRLATFQPVLTTPSASATINTAFDTKSAQPTEKKRNGTPVGKQDLFLALQEAKPTPTSADQVSSPPLSNPVAEPAPPTANGCIAAVVVALTVAKQPWPFFPAPEPAIEEGRVAPLRKRGQTVLNSDGLPQPQIVRFKNENYAEAADLADAQLRNGIEEVRKRGVEIIALFPDGADHIHIDVRQQP